MYKSICVVILEYDIIKIGGSKMPKRKLHMKTAQYRCRQHANEIMKYNMQSYAIKQKKKIVELDAHE